MGYRVLLIKGVLESLHLKGTLEGRFKSLYWVCLSIGVFSFRGFKILRARWVLGRPVILRGVTVVLFWFRALILLGVSQVFRVRVLLDRLVGVISCFVLVVLRGVSGGLVW